MHRLVPLLCEVSRDVYCEVQRQLPDRRAEIANLNSSR